MVSFLQQTSKNLEDSWLEKSYPAKVHMGTVGQAEVCESLYPDQEPEFQKTITLVTRVTTHRLILDPQHKASTLPGSCQTL